MKHCKICLEYLDSKNFHKKTKNKDGLDHRCKSCKAKENKTRYLKPDVKLASKVASRKFSMKKIGITQEQINHFYSVQSSRCAICFMTEEDHGKLLALDHNHATGKARGLLCQQCNTGLGNFRDDVSLLSRAIAYLCVTP